MADQLVINSATPIGSGRFYYKLDTNQGTYYYTPTEFLNQGLLQGNTQFFESGFIRNPEITKNLKSIEIAPGILQDKIGGLYENANRGILLTQEQAAKIMGGGKETFSDWNNVTSSGGVVDNYDITQANRNTGSAFGPIGGMGEFQGNLVYTRPTEANSNYSYITPYDQYDSGYSMRNTNVTVEKKGGLLGSAIRTIGGAFGDIPVIGDIAAYAIGGPALLGVVKGGQIAAAGGSPMDAFKAGATSGALIGAGQALTGGASFVPEPTTAVAAPAEYAALADAFGTDPSVPSAFNTAVNTALGQTPELGQFGSVGTSGFGTALPSAAEVAAGLTSAGFAPGTAANLAGQTAAGVGATNLLGGATAAAPLAAEASPISIQQALQGARLVNSLLNPQQPQTPNLLNRAQELLKTQGAVDYTSLLGLLNQRAQTSGLLGTRYQPQSINLASLLG